MAKSTNGTKNLKEALTPDQVSKVEDKYKSIYSGMLKGNKKKLMKYIDPKLKRPNPDAMAMGRAINLVKKETETVNEEESISKEPKIGDYIPTTMGRLAFWRDHQKPRTVVKYKGHHPNISIITRDLKITGKEKTKFGTYWILNNGEYKISVNKLKDGVVETVNEAADPKVLSAIETLKKVKAGPKRKEAMSIVLDAAYKKTGEKARTYKQALQFLDLEEPINEDKVRDMLSASKWRDLWDEHTEWAEANRTSTRKDANYPSARKQNDNIFSLSTKYGFDPIEIKKLTKQWEKINDRTYGAINPYEIWMDDKLKDGVVETVNENESLKLGVKYELPTGETGFIMTGGSDDPRDWKFSGNKQPYLSVEDKLTPLENQPGKYDGAFDMGHGKGHHIDEELVNEDNSYDSFKTDESERFLNRSQVVELLPTLKNSLNKLNFSPSKQPTLSVKRYGLSSSNKGYVISMYIPTSKDDIIVELGKYPKDDKTDEVSISLYLPNEEGRLTQVAYETSTSPKGEELAEDSNVLSKVISMANQWYEKPNTIDERLNTLVKEVYSEKQRKWACAQDGPEFDEMCKDTAISKKKLKETTMNNNRLTELIKSALTGPVKEEDLERYYKKEDEKEKLKRREEEEMEKSSKEDLKTIKAATKGFDDEAMMESSTLKEGIWSMGTVTQIENFLKDLNRLKDKYYNIVGSDDVFDGLDRAERSAEEMMMNAPENRHDLDEDMNEELATTPIKDDIYAIGSRIYKDPYEAISLVATDQTVVVRDFARKDKKFKAAVMDYVKSKGLETSVDRDGLYIDTKPLDFKGIPLMNEKQQRPDYPDIDGDGDTKEPMAKAAKDKEKAEANESFDSLAKKLDKQKGITKDEAAKIAGSIAAKKMKGAGKGPTAKQKKRMAESIFKKLRG